MAVPESQPTEADIRDFAAKLDEFYDSLPGSQKVILETLTAAALSPRVEVEGFDVREYILLFALIDDVLPPLLPAWAAKGLHPRERGRPST